jgi:prevent-host-death family protein
MALHNSYYDYNKCKIYISYYGAITMYKIAAREAKNEFGRLLDNAQREPITIEKKGRPVAVVLSIPEYERLEQMEDYYWAKLADEAEKEGFLGVEESEKLLAEIRNAKD